MCNQNYVEKPRDSAALVAGNVLSTRLNEINQYSHSKYQQCLCSVKVTHHLTVRQSNKLPVLTFKASNGHICANFTGQGQLQSSSVQTTTSVRSDLHFCRNSLPSQLPQPDLSPISQTLLPGAKDTSVLAFLSRTLTQWHNKNNFTFKVNSTKTTVEIQTGKCFTWSRMSHINQWWWSTEEKGCSITRLLGNNGKVQWCKPIGVCFIHFQLASQFCHLSPSHVHTF